MLIPSLPPLLEKILGLEGLRDKDSEPKAGDGNEVSEEARNPFTTAGPVRPATARPARQISSNAGFTPVEEGKTTQLVRTIGRALVILVALVLLLAGLRTLVSPPKQKVVQLPAKENTFPVGSAQAVAARWARVYLTLPGEGDDAAQKTRQSTLKVDQATNLPDQSNDWNAKGKTTAAEVIPGQVTPSDNTHARVQVLAQLSDVKHDDKAKKDTTSPPRWVTLEVPMEAAHGRAYVSGTPAFVSMPGPGAVDTNKELPGVDDQATNASKTNATAFFQALAGTDQAALDAAAAPGAHITPLGQGFKLKSVSNWQISKDTSSSRTAAATVVWSLGDSGAELTQNYAVQVVNVSAGNAQGWRIQSLTAQPDLTSTN